MFYTYLLYIYAIKKDGEKFSSAYLLLKIHIKDDECGKPLPREWFVYIKLILSQITIVQLKALIQLENYFLTFLQRTDSQ